MEEKKKKNDVFAELAAVNINEFVEVKDGKRYLPWTYAWKEVKKRYPDAMYQVYRYEGELPYVYDERTGYMVTTAVTIDGVTHEMWLPVMDGANKAMKAEPYTYKVYNRVKAQYVEKKVEAATMFDINKTIMRCLVKNIAMFGLALYIYAGEELPMDDEGTQTQAEPTDYIQAIKNAQTLQELELIYRGAAPHLSDDEKGKLIKMLTERKNEINGTKNA